jgi:hypothetical protein
MGKICFRHHDSATGCLYWLLFKGWLSRYFEYPYCSWKEVMTEDTDHRLNIEPFHDGSPSELEPRTGIVALAI